MLLLQLLNGLKALASVVYLALLVASTDEYVLARLRLALQELACVLAQLRERLFNAMLLPKPCVLPPCAAAQRTPLVHDGPVLTPHSTFDSALSSQSPSISTPPPWPPSLNRSC